MPTCAELWFCSRVLALNQDRANVVVGLKTTVHPKRVVPAFISGRSGAALEVWLLKEAVAYFFEIFRRELFVEVA